MKLFIFIIGISLTASIYGQSKKMTLDELKALGRDSLIAIAAARAKNSYPDFKTDLFDRIRVKISRGSLWVIFDNAIQFVPRKSAFIYDMSVNLTENSLGTGPIENDKELKDFEEYQFFKPTKNARKAIEFVLNAINNDNEIGDIPDGKLPDDTQMTIIEKSDYYAIEVDSYSTVSHYKIKKGSGKIYDASHKHYARDWDEKAEEEVIK
ncbi:hypothetical protein K1X84_15830 [bacterium]|nr:hypothetical protein [bacterium]